MAWNFLVSANPMPTPCAVGVEHLLVDEDQALRLLIRKVLIRLRERFASHNVRGGEVWRFGRADSAQPATARDGLHCEIG